MKKNYWFYLFIAVLAGDLIGIYRQNDLLQYIFKPLIIPVVAGYFLSQTENVLSSLKKWIMAALLFSWIGDILLMFDTRSEIFFLAGLGSFLVAHIFYILFFRGIWKKEVRKIDFRYTGLVAIYYIGLIILLFNYLGDKKIPVLVYGVVISYMFLLALHMLFIRYRKLGRLMMLGALLFVISDSVLAINKFYSPFEYAGIVIMITYGFAQFFIAEGAGRYIRAVKSN